MLERSISKIIVRHLASPFVFIATFLVGVAAVSLSSFSASRELESIEPLTPAQIESMSPPMVQNEVPELDKVSVPKITQSAVVHFPHHGAIRVESVEQVGEFPKIIFFDRKSHLVLFQSSIEDPDGFLKPTADTDFTRPFLRFREVLSPGFPSPLIMAVAVRPGGSDNGFYLTIFSEINGKIVQLTDKSIDTAIQGGYYLGFLNSKLGFGLISWGFVWDFNKNDPHEAHYDPHHYLMAIYSLKSGKFHKTFSSISKRKYAPENSFGPLRELNIRALDMRKTIPKVREYADAEG